MFALNQINPVFKAQTLCLEEPHNPEDKCLSRVAKLNNPLVNSPLKLFKLNRRHNHSRCLNKLP
jgi:hypothetical protein